MLPCYQSHAIIQPLKIGTKVSVKKYSNKPEPSVQPLQDFSHYVYTTVTVTVALQCQVAAVSPDAL